MDGVNKKGIVKRGSNRLKGAVKKTRNAEPGRVTVKDYWLEIRRWEG